MTRPLHGLVAYNVVHDVDTYMIQCLCCLGFQNTMLAVPCCTRRTLCRGSKHHFPKLKRLALPMRWYVGHGRLRSRGARRGNSNNDRRSESCHTSRSGFSKNSDDSTADAVTSLKIRNMQLSLRGSLGMGSEIWAFCEVDENEGKQAEVWGRFWQVCRFERLSTCTMRAIVICHVRWHDPWPRISCAPYWLSVYRL